MSATVFWPWDEVTERTKQMLQKLHGRDVEVLIYEVDMEHYPGDVLECFNYNPDAFVYVISTAQAFTLAPCGRSFGFTEWTGKDLERVFHYFPERPIGSRIEEVWNATEVKHQLCGVTLN